MSDEYFTIQFNKDDYIAITDEEFNIIEYKHSADDYEEDEFYVDNEDPKIRIWWRTESDERGSVNLKNPLFICHLDQWYLHKGFFDEYTSCKTYESWKESLEDAKIDLQIMDEVAEFRLKRFQELKGQNK